MPLNTAKMVFESIFPVEVDVEIEGNPYLLVECNATRAAQWKDAQAKAMKLNDGEVSGLDEMSKTDALLVSYCLFDVSKGKGLKDRLPVPLTTIEGWPHSITSQLFERAKEISRLEPKLPLKVLRKQLKKLEEQIRVLTGEAEDPSKNWPDTTPPTTDGPPNGELMSTASSAIDS